MVFNSLTYLLFVPLIFAIFLLTGERWKWLVLLVSSYVFYAFLLHPVLLLVLAGVTAMTFVSGRMIHASRGDAERARNLYLGVVGNLAVLFYFKYLNFLAISLNQLLALAHADVALPVPAILVSIALSFFIFQAISYLADIYFGSVEPEPHFGYFALYISFFPKLLQGPIERASDLLPQLHQPYVFSYERARSGLILFAWGLFQKLAIADRLGAYVNPVYANVHEQTGAALLFASYAYAVQIYFDFAGYTDMARGIGRLFGIELSINFNSPYMATSVADFWRRWHISFSRWILDYIFQPLQMKFRNLGKHGVTLALLATFTLAGVWHGASWCYIVFGLLHGIYLVSSTYYKPYQKKMYRKLGIEKAGWLKYWQRFVVFQLVTFAFIFFRSESIGDALYVVAHCLDFRGDYAALQAAPWSIYVSRYLFNFNGATELLLALLGLGAAWLVFDGRALAAGARSAALRWTGYYVLVYFTLFCWVAFSNSTSFVYFNF